MLFAHFRQNSNLSCAIIALSSFFGATMYLLLNHFAVCCKLYQKQLCSLSSNEVYCKNLPVIYNHSIMCLYTPPTPANRSSHYKAETKPKTFPYVSVLPSASMLQPLQQFLYLLCFCQLRPPNTHVEVNESYEYLLR